MAVFRVFTGLVLLETGSNVGVGNTFIASGSQIVGATDGIIFLRHAGDDFIQRDRNAAEVQDDVDGDQIVFIRDSTDNVLIDGSGVHLDPAFQVTVDGAGPFSGFQFEVEGSGEDFIFIQPGVPDGAATFTALMLVTASSPAITGTSAFTGTERALCGHRATWHRS